MKKTLTFLVVCIFLTVSAFAGKQNLFSIDESHLNSELAELTALENYLADNTATLTSLTEQNHLLVANFSSNSGWRSIAGLAEPPLGVSSFIWGFCLGLPGLAIVYFVAEDPAETKKALWGCIASTVLYSVFYVVWYAAWSAAWM